jgi:hypothetical protein
MSDTFNDGDPIDATLLQKLKTDVAKATALAGGNTKAGSTINIELEPKAAEITNPQFFGGKTAAKKVYNGKRTTFTIDYSKANFSGNPSGITLTAVSTSGLADIKEPSIVSGSVGAYTAEVQIWGSGDTKSVSIYFIAVKN